MTNHKPLIPSVAEPHPSVEKLYQYLEGKLPAPAAHQLEQHLLGCELCAEALEGLALVPQSDAEHALFDINRNISKRSSRQKKNNLLRDIKNWGLLAAIIFLLLFSAVLVWYQVTRSTTHVPHPPIPAKNSVGLNLSPLRQIPATGLNLPSVFPSV